MVTKCSSALGNVTTACPNVVLVVADTHGYSKEQECHVKQCYAMLRSYNYVMLYNVKMKK